MKRFRSLVSIGVLFAIFWFSFSIFDTFKIFDKTFEILGFKKTTIERPYIESTDDPIPPPPPPPKKNG